MTERQTVEPGANPELATPSPSRSVPPAGREGGSAERLPAPVPGEVGGPKGPEPTRYGDWENKGRASDF